MRRTIRGLGSAEYTPEEDFLARKLIDGGHADEVALLHEMKATFDARLVRDDAAEMLTRQMERERVSTPDPQMRLEAA